MIVAPCVQKTNLFCSKVGTSPVYLSGAELRPCQFINKGMSTYKLFHIVYTFKRLLNGEIYGCISPLADYTVIGLEGKEGALVLRL
jgi:hypothetical protein